MTKKTMLITGASRGIGKAIHEKFKDTYNVVTAHRTEGATYQCNLINWQQREKLLRDITPDIFINNAGHFGGNLTTIGITGCAVTHLMLGFYNKMPRGTIINISSTRAVFDGHMGIKTEDIAYNSAKRMVSAASVQLATSKTKPVNVMCIEPGPVKTDMMPHLTDPVYTEYELWDNSVYTPLMPVDIANTVEYLLNLPPWINIPLLRLDSSSRLESNES